MNFPRVRSILWDATPDNEDELGTNIDNRFIISAEQLLSSEWVWKTDIVGDVRAMLRQQKQDSYFVTIHETWCETGNTKVFARKLTFETLSDTFRQGDKQPWACIPLLVSDHSQHEATKYQTKKLSFGGFWLCDLFQVFPPKLEMEEYTSDIVLRLRIHVPDVQFVFTKISSPRVHNMEFIQRYDISNNDNKELSCNNFGFLSMNTVRKLILYSKDDPDIHERQPVVGIWIFVNDRLDPATLWMACYDFLFWEDLYERVLQNGSFLVLLCNENQQKHSVLCCNVEAKLGTEYASPITTSSSLATLREPSRKAYSCYFTIPQQGGKTDITGYLGLPVKIYRIFASSTTTPGQTRRVTYSSFVGKQSNESNDSSTLQNNISTKTSEEDIEERQENVTKPPSRQTTRATQQPENQKQYPQQETTKQQLQRLHKEMESLKGYFRRLGLTPEEYQENNNRKTTILPRETSKFWNHSRRPRSPSQEDISEDSVFAKKEGGTGHIMSPVSSATDGDAKNELFHTLKTTALPVYGRQPNNSWPFHKTKAKTRIDAAVQVDWSENNNRTTNSQEYDGTCTNHKEEPPWKGNDVSLKVDEQVVTDDLLVQGYSRRHFESSEPQNSCLTQHRHVLHSSSWSSHSYKTFSAETKSPISTCVERGESSPSAPSRGSSYSYHHREPRKTFVKSRKKRKGYGGQYGRNQVGTSRLVESGDDTPLDIPKIIYTGLSEEEDYESSCWNGTTLWN